MQKKFKESSYSICENVCFSSKKMFFIYFLKQFRKKISVGVAIKVVFLHLLSQQPGF